MIRCFDTDDFEEAPIFETTSLLETPSSKPPPKCQKLIKTGFLCVGFFGMGLASTIPGPTLDYLEQQNNVNKEHISYIYPARSLGYLLGSLVSGVLFDKYPGKDKLLIALGLIVTGVGLTVSAWGQALSLVCVCMSVSGIAMGSFDTGGNVVCLKIWNKDSAPYLRSLHFSFGVGALVAPLIAAPFFTTVLPGYTTALPATSTLTPPAVEHFINKREYFVRNINHLPNPYLKSVLASYSTVVNLPTARTDHNSSINLPANLNINSTDNESSTRLTNGNFSWTTTLLKKLADSKVIKAIGSSEADVSDRNGEAPGDQIGSRKQKLKRPASMEINDDSSTLLLITPDSDITAEATSNSSEVNSPLGANSTANINSTTTVMYLSSKRQSSLPIVSEIRVPSHADGSRTASILPEALPALVTTILPTTETTNAVNSIPIALGTTAHEKMMLPIVTVVSTTQVTTASNLPTSTIEATASTKTPQGTTIYTSSEIAPSLVTVSTAPEQHITSTRTSSRVRSPNVKYAYLIIGVVLLIGAISFCFLQCCGGEDSIDSRVDSKLNVDNEPETESSTVFKVNILILASLFFMLYNGIEVTFGQFISSFGQEAYSLTEKDGAYLSSIYWTAFAIGRGLSIPLSRCLSPTAQIIVSLIFSLTSAIGLVVTTLKLSSVHILFMLAAFCGVGCAAVFPSGVLWIEQHIRVSAKMMIAFVVGSSFGQMWIPAVVGYYFVHLGPISLMYMTLGCIIGCAVLFSAMQCVAKRPLQTCFNH